MLVIFAEIDAGLVGSEGVAYVYHPSAESDEEMEELVQDMWGLAVTSDLEDGDSDGSVSDDEDSLPASPAPDDSQCK